MAADTALGLHLRVYEGYVGCRHGGGVEVPPSERLTYGLNAWSRIDQSLNTVSAEESQLLCAGT